MNIKLPDEVIKYTKGAGWAAPVRQVVDERETDVVFNILVVPSTWGPAMDKFNNLGMSIDLTEKQEVKEKLEEIYKLAKEAIPKKWFVHKEDKKKPLEVTPVFTDQFSGEHPNSLFLKFWENKDETYWTKCYDVQNGVVEIAPQEIQQGAVVSVKFKISLSCKIDTQTKTASVNFQHKLIQVKVLEQGTGPKVVVDEEEQQYLDMKRQKTELVMGSDQE